MDNQNPQYRKRIIDQKIREELEVIGAVVVEGAKWCGKTTTSKQFAKSELLLSDSEQMSTYLGVADMNPSILLEGDNPRLIDEWQLAPKLWDSIRHDVDKRNANGLYVLTGSTTPPDTSQIFHSGAGRFAWVKMRPMSLYESGESSGKISLKELFTSPDGIAAECDLTDLRDLAFLTCRGGWPKATTFQDEKALRLAFDYVDAIVRSDISRVDGIMRSPERALKLLRSLARHQSTQASNETILADMGEDSGNIATVNSYLDALARIFVTENALAWNPNLRSKTALRTSDTHYFVDPSIATAALGLGPDDLINDIRTFGFIFETFAVRDLRIYTEALGGSVYHYRDKNGLECNSVLHLRNGKYALVEIKLGGDRFIEDGADKLKTLAGKLDTDKMGDPAFLAVVVGIGKYAYRRKDGVFVVPIGCLKD